MGYGRCIRSISISCVFSPLFQVAGQVESWKLSVASCQARSILFKASYKLPGQVARQVASGKLTGQVGKLQVARSSCQQVGNLPAQVDKLPAMGGTGDHELNSGFFTTSCPAPCFNIAGQQQTSSKTVMSSILLVKHQTDVSHQFLQF